MSKNKSIGMGFQTPKETCEDPNCPFHGSLKVGGRTLTGTVISDKMSKSVTVSFERRIYVQKYERYAKEFTKLKAHNPDCIRAVKGDNVTIVETRPLSKTKNFVVVRVNKPEATTE